MHVIRPTIHNEQRLRHGKCAQQLQVGAHSQQSSRIEVGSGRVGRPIEISGLKRMASIQAMLMQDMIQRNKSPFDALFHCGH